MTYKIVNENHNHNNEVGSTDLYYKKYKEKKKYDINGFTCIQQIGDYCILTHELNDYDTLVEVKEWVNLVKDDYTLNLGATGSASIIAQCNNFLNIK